MFYNELQYEFLKIIVDMKKVDLNTEIEITDESKEQEVEANYRCFFTEHQCFEPMWVSGSIHVGHSLQDFIKEGKKEYEKQFLKVEVIDVRIGDYF